MPVGFLAEDRDSWNSRYDFKVIQVILTSQAITNDHAKRELALILNATKSG